MRKQFHLSSSFNFENRRKVSFVVSVTLIALLLIASLIGIFTGKFRPFADQLISINSPSRTVLYGTIVVPPGSLAFTDGDGKQQLVQSNTVDMTLGSQPSGNVSFQGITNTPDTAAHLAIVGKVSVRKSDDTPLTDSPVDWTSSGFVDTKNLKTDFDNQQLLDALDAQNGGSLKFTIKPNDYLGVAATTSNLDQAITFPEAPVGDLNNDNKIDEADFAIWSQYVGKPVTADTTRFDFNKNGVIDEQDFAIWSTNFGKTGAGL